jgi:hypothetical protein
VSLDAGPVKSLRIRFKALESRDKKSRIPACFTFCLPGRPKVNAGGACGAGLAEARCLADFRFDHPSGQARERHRFRNPRKIAAGRYF